MNTLTSRWIALAPVLVLSACVQSSSTRTSHSPAAPPIQGRVVLQGEVPASRVITAPPPLTTVFPDGIVVTPYRVGPDHGLAEVVVSIVNPPSVRPAPSAATSSLLVSNTVCEPRVLAVQTNQPVRFTVRGGQMLNLMASAPQRDGWNQAVPADAEFEKRFPSAGARYRITDNVHPWLSASVWTFDHPWFAVTDATGAFELPPLAPGRYTLQFEHRAGGRSTQEIEVPVMGEPLTLTMRISTPTAGL